MTRRRFAFWLGLFLFWLSRKLHAEVVDTVAASLMEWSDPERSNTSEVERWRPNASRQWHWYERQRRVDGKWRLSAVTTPIDRKTGSTYPGGIGYLDEDVVPEPVRKSTQALLKKLDLGEPELSRRIAHGRPPSKWLRSLHANEIKLWLRMIEVPEAGVEGMTFWTHLTRDHSFSPERIDGLTVPEQAKLHAAAHHGY